MRTVDILRRKRDGEALAKEEIEYFVKGAVSGSIPDYQISAFLMAVYQRGMTMDETVELTRAMMNSGKTLDIRMVTGIKVDKHSTGGVGDKTSIVLAPLLAVMGVKVPMIAGRGLGHTGGTLDKLASIPGMRTDLSFDEIIRQLESIGCVIAGQTEDLVPADRIFYSLRDVTATVESLPLIASSIMSKKLAEGVEGLVVDVKTGSGAFMKDLESARRLGRMLVDIGNAMGVRTAAVISTMDEPLGRCVGNALEIKECISAMRGKGAPDLMELIYNLAAWMLNLTDAVGEEAPPMMLNDMAFRNYKHEVMEFLDKGDAYKRFAELVDAQGGDPEVVFQPNLIPVAKNIKSIMAPASGYVRRLDAYHIGTASMLLGAGRMKAEDSIDLTSGIVLNKKVGDKVLAGEPVAMLHYNDGASLREAEEAFMASLEIGERDIAKRPLVIETIM